MAAKLSHQRLLGGRATPLGISQDDLKQTCLMWDYFRRLRDSRKSAKNTTKPQMNGTV